MHFWICNQNRWLQMLYNCLFSTKNVYSFLKNLDHCNLYGSTFNIKPQKDYIELPNRAYCYCILINKFSQTGCWIWCVERKGKLNDQIYLLIEPLFWPTCLRTKLERIKTKGFIYMRELYEDIRSEIKKKIGAHML